MKRIVLDTNCLIAALPSRSAYHKIWEDFVGGKYILCVSNEICAICGNASFIVSEDAHFRVLKQIAFPSITLLTIKEFVALPI